jgi:hypothetical protein
MFNRFFQFISLFVNFISHLSYSFLVAVFVPFCVDKSSLGFNLKNVTFGGISPSNVVRSKVKKNYSANILTNLSSKAESHGGITYPTPIHLNYS